MAGRQLSHRNQGSTTLGPARTRIPEGLAAAAAAAVAFACYYATLLPGLDLGDSASFQTIAGKLTATPRQAYPLYYALGNLFVWLHPGEPARAMNLASAVYGAAAVGMATTLAARLAHSVLAGLAAGLFLAFSYTFWSQSLTAEVYTLHILFVGAAFVTLLSWAEHPTAGRLAWFYAVYALGFGNHLSMILLLPSLTVFLLLSRRAGPADPLRPRMIAMAIGVASAGALQYAWNFRGLWTTLEPPSSIAEALAKFWFDVTKADWRETLVMNLSEQGLQSRPSMYWFDVRQQFGAPGVALAALGSAYVMVRWPRRGLLLILAYLANLAFAWTYNVGDAYIFFLPSHYVIALFAGAGIAAIFALTAWVSSRGIATALSAVCLVYPAWRGYDTFPAVDRGSDTRAVELLDRFTTPPRLNDAQGSEPAVFGVDTNWQVQNAFEYYMRERKPGIPWFMTDELEWLDDDDNIMPRVQAFLDANREMGRHVVVAPGAYQRFNLHIEDGSDIEVVEERGEPFRSRVRSVPPLTPYALAILRPDREYLLDDIEIPETWRWLTAGSMAISELHQYTIVLGLVGRAPLLVHSAEHPYRIRARVGELDVDVRMESWLPTDTIRRAGFGHVVVGRQHRLTLERGVSFVTLDQGGRPLYSAGLFSPIPRFILAPLPQ